MAVQGLSGHLFTATRHIVRNHRQGDNKGTVHISVDGIGDYFTPEHAEQFAREIIEAAQQSRKLAARMNVRDMERTAQQQKLLRND